MAKRAKKKPITPDEIVAALARGGLKPVKITKVNPPKTVEVSPAYAKKAARAAERKKAKIVKVPEKYQKALKKHGLGSAQRVIKRRGRYYAAAGLYQISKHKLKINTRRADVQNVYAWEPSDRKGWFVKIVNGVVQPKLARWNDIKREQNAAFRKEKIRVVAEKTGLTQKAVRAIISEIRREESAKLKRYRKTKKYKRLTKAERRRLTIHNRTIAVFGALCDFLEVYGSPKAAPDAQDPEKTKKGKRAKKNENTRTVQRNKKHRKSVRRARP